MKNPKAMGKTKRRTLRKSEAWTAITTANIKHGPTPCQINMSLTLKSFNSLFVNSYDQFSTINIRSV